MKLTSDNEVLAEGKILILYLLDKLTQPLTNIQIMRLILNVQDMNYFYFQQFLSDLLNKKYIITYLKENNSVYEISPEGRKTLSFTENLLPGILKFNLDKSIKNNLDSVKNEINIVCEHITESEKMHMIKCKIVENYSVIFEVSLFAGSIEQAKLIEQNWKEHAFEIYPKIIELLTD